MKLCKDCKHFQPGMGGDVGSCRSVDVAGEDRVLGGALSVDPYKARSAAMGDCGPDAEYWEAKDGQ